MQIVERFLKLESASGILLIGAMGLAMVMANTPLDSYYQAILDLPVEVRVGALQLDKPLLLWINDGLMAIFFMLVGLEVKREILVGRLSEPSNVVLPVIAAVGGMLVPALCFTYFNWGDAIAMRGWAIPTATDIAFALGILSLLGSRVPIALKLFLMTLAIIDDLGAILIIALFYTTELSALSLYIAEVTIALLFIMNRMGVMRIAAYMILGVVLWVSVLKSGVHATLAGVVLAFAIPLRNPEKPTFSPLKWLEQQLHPWVAFAILPFFAFANAGVPLSAISLDMLFASAPVGIMAGLFIGKQVGVFLFTWLAIVSGIAKKPQGADWRSIYGVSLLTGIGFTMSLFVDSLAYEGMADIYGGADRLAILLGSFFSAVAGYWVLKNTLKH